MSATAPPYTRKLAAFVDGLRYEDLPAAVVSKAKGTLLDFLACALGGSVHPHAQQALGVFRQLGGNPEATILGTSERAPITHAAFLNSLYGSSTPQQDDVWKESLGHPGVAVHPPGLATAERCGASGRDLITAIVVGYELGMRIGSAVGKAGLDNGWHPRGGLNVFASAATSAKLLGLRGVDTHANVLGLAGNAASGITGASYFFDAWYTLSGQAAHNGVLAALLAQAGYSAGPSVLEADFGGYLPLVVREPGWQKLDEELGERYEIMRIGQKVHASSGATHAAIDATLALVSEHDITADNVDRVEVKGFRSMVERTGKPFPSNRVHAGMSVPFLVATAIVHRQVGLDQTKDGAREDPMIAALQGRMELSVDPELDALAPMYLPASVKIITRSRETYSKTVTIPRGDAENPLADDDLQAKFHRLATGVIADRQAERVIELVAELDSLPEVSMLTAQLRGT